MIVFKPNLTILKYRLLGNILRIFIKKVNFFGNLATTTTIPAQLVKKYNCELVPIYIERKKSNYFKIYISKPIKISKTKSILEITEFLNQVLEKMILKNIDQWIWTHDRWKS